MATVTSSSVLPDAHETETGHRCSTWHNRGAAGGITCQHRFILLPHEVHVAKLRADRVSTVSA
jgi:hypothetical protein